MDRATLIAHVAEFSALDLPLSRRAATAHTESALRRRLFGGLHTAHLLELCTTIAADGDRKQPLNLPGEAGGYSVYRIQFADGAAYVGMTSQPVFRRIARHLNGEGSTEVWRHFAGSLEYRLDVLASGLSERRAREREAREIRALPSPLNKMIPRQSRPAIDPARQVPVDRVSPARWR